MMESVAYMFPGQGAQQPGMGEALFAKYSDLVADANDILSFDILKICSGEDGRLNSTECTQPALFFVNHLHWLERREFDSRLPAYMLGHSLGQYNALVAAGIVDFEQALMLVRERGRLMALHASGGMAAVMKLNLQEIQSVLVQHPSGKDVDIANINSKQQIVIAARHDVLEQVTEALQAAGAFVVPLKVSGGFHSRLTAAAADAFAPFLQRVTPKPSSVQVICNVTATPLDPSELTMRLHEHITRPVQWCASIEYLLTEGVTDYHEIGVGKTLSGMQRYIEKNWHSTRDAARSS